MRSSALAISLCAALELAGCANAPTRGDLSAAILFDAKGSLIPSAFNAAIRSQLPPGTPLAEVEAYMSRLGAGCSYNLQDVIYACTIPLDKRHCGMHINVRVDSESDRLTSLDAAYDMEWCD